MRAALYWAPSVHDPLWALGCSWLGRDAETGGACVQPAVADIAELTAAASRYGFHATLQPPVRLATGWDEFRQAAAQIARSVEPFALPALEVAELDGFLALRETAPCPPLQALAARCVELSYPHRLPPSAEELARRRAAGLNPRQEAMLQRWGYPYVMQDWFFHMTLTRRLAAGELGAARLAAGRHFASALALPRRVEEICIFTEGGGPFLIAERMRLG